MLLLARPTMRPSVNELFVFKLVLTWARGHKAIEKLPIKWGVIVAWAQSFLPGRLRMKNITMDHTHGFVDLIIVDIPKGDLILSFEHYPK